jgi:sulfate transport system ATP-binding protein
MKIALHEVTKRFGAFTALDQVDLDIHSGELVALLGPSGSGKTTLLRIIAGLDWPDQGEVRFDGEDALSRSVGERNVGFVFQNYALFRHMTVFENVAFGLRARPRRLRPSEAEIRARVKQLLELVQLGPLGKRLPAQLSGGQRQRIALARALAIEPRILLLDEPFGALDAKVRKELRRWLRRLHDEVHVTSLFVTHDQEEALEIADRVVVMRSGRIEQVGTPDEVYQTPANPFVYEFLGDVNTFHGRQPAYARPYEIEVFRERVQDGLIKARVEHVSKRGYLARVELVVGEDARTIEADLSRERLDDLALAKGQQVYIRPTALRVFEAPAAAE